MKDMIIMAALCGVFSVTASCGDSQRNALFSDDPQSGITAPQAGELLDESTVKWDFANLDGWELANQGSDLVDNSSIVDDATATDGKALRIYTEAGSQQRKKVRTVKQYGSGLYTWRMYISDLGIGEKVSIGGFLWHDDTHELDFEIGSGSSAARSSLSVANDQVIAFMSSMDHPYLQQTFKITKNAWHVFQMDLKLVNGKYFATWLIDGNVYAAQQLDFGEEYPFYIYCSTENLNFIGDGWPTKDNYGLWDYVTYTPYSYSMEPVTPQPNEPDEGVTLIWDLNDNAIPAGWKVQTDVGVDGEYYCEFKENALFLSNDDYCHTAKIQYDTPVGFGRYALRIRLPEMTSAVKHTSGIVLYTSNEDNGYHGINLVGWYGSDDERTRLGATGNQLLLRVYCEIPFIETNVAVLDPNIDYKFSIELRNNDGNYVIHWLLDDTQIYMTNTSFSPAQVKFLYIIAAESRAWMPGTDPTQRYTSRIDDIQYTEFLD